METNPKVAVIGAGYVGLVLALVLARHGKDVTVLDRNDWKIKSIEDKKPPFYEPQLQEYLNEYPIKATKSYKEAITDADFIFICVGTPEIDDNISIEYILEACEQMKPYLKEGVTIIQRSTVPVGTCERIQKELNTKNVIMMPEFLSQGSAFDDTENSSRLVFGYDKDLNINGVLDLFDWCESEQLFMDVRSAELVKIASNGFLATKISYANLIAKIAHEQGADSRRVLEGVGSDPRIGHRHLRAGIGFGGGCLPKDTTALMRLEDNPIGLINTVKDINDLSVAYAVSRIMKIIPEKSKVLVLGYTFKPDTSDIRESPARKLSNYLGDKEFEVAIIDPSLEDRSSYEKGFENSSMVVLATEWEEFQDIDWKGLKSLMKEPNIFDARNALDEIYLTSLEYNYYHV